MNGRSQAFSGLMRYSASITSIPTSARLGFADSPGSHMDLEHLVYGYGNRPNVPLTVFGLITSVPQPDESTFDPMKEFEMTVPLAERVAFEKSFRAVFGAMDGLESFVRYSRYPNVTVHPIAVYRSFSHADAAD